MNAGILLGIFIIILSKMRPFNPYAFGLALVPLIIVQLYAKDGMVIIMDSATFEHLIYWLVCSFLVWTLKRKRDGLDKGTETMVCILSVLAGEMAWMIWGLIFNQTENILELRKLGFQIFRFLIIEVIPIQLVVCIVINVSVSYVKDYLDYLNEEEE